MKIALIYVPQKNAFILNQDEPATLGVDVNVRSLCKSGGFLPTDIEIEIKDHAGDVVLALEKRLDELAALVDALITEKNKACVDLAAAVRELDVLRESKKKASRGGR